MNRSHLLLSACLVAACSDAGPVDPDPAVSAQQISAPVPIASTSAVAPETSASAAVALVPPPIPTLVAEEVPAAKAKESFRLRLLGSHLIAVGSKTVGRVTEDGIEWVKATIAPDSSALGPTSIGRVSGRWPDRIDVLFSYANPRATVPTYWPLTGKGGFLAFAPGGGGGSIYGVATVGDTTLVAGWDYDGGNRIMTARGPVVRLSHIPSTKGCKPGEVEISEFTRQIPPAVDPMSFGSSGAGTVFSIGTLCNKGGLAAEIWDAKGESKIVPLKELEGSVSYGADIIPRTGDRAWIISYEKGIVSFDSGTFSLVPAPPKKADVFVSDDDVLYANDGSEIYRRDGEQWVTVGKLAWSHALAGMQRYQNAFWGMMGEGQVGRLVPGESIEFRDGCATPFVHLYNVSYTAEPGYTFPTTRKALSSFADVEKVTLVEYREGARRLGLAVPSKEVGLAAIAHVKATMKDEAPKLLCYQPKAPREIAIRKK